jgi:putative chitinase
MIPVTQGQLTQLAPQARAEYLQTFADADTVLAKYGINDNGLRLSHFMAQVLHETGGLKILTESMNYKPDALIALFSRKRISIEDAQRLGRTDAHPADQRGIANILYGGAFGKAQLGNTEPDDGWNFRGTGLLQMTGRDSRTRIGEKLTVGNGEDLTVDLLNIPPDNAIDPRYLLQIACEEWKEKGCNVPADADNITRVTKLINGGNIGLAERTAWLVKTKAVWLPA